MPSRLMASIEGSPTYAFVIQHKLVNVAEMMAGELLIHPRSQPQYTANPLEQLRGLQMLRKLQPDRNDLPTREEANTYLNAYSERAMGGFGAVEFDPRKFSCSIELFRPLIEKLNASEPEWAN